MALLIVLSIVGSATTLVGLYILGVFISQYVVAVTKMFKENVNNIIEKSRAKRAEKKEQAKEAEEIKQETSNDEIKVEIEDVIEEMKN